MNTTSTDRADVPGPAPRPEPPTVGELHVPDDLRPLHHQLITRAAEIADLDDAGEWTAAAVKVVTLRDSWRNRQHDTAAHPAMREAANQAVQALIVGLRADDWREARRWFRLADGWINDLRMQGESGSPFLVPARRPEPLLRRVLAGLLGR
ncbi:hypothetical protein [Amycolatopsis sp. NPDC051903]|uniref:hypothetical protein n=1 Tax=Amycolatopsis sp. NPDC051903 TaxID=3363936 RepID=UPI0037952F28